MDPGATGFDTKRKTDQMSSTLLNRIPTLTKVRRQTSGQALLSRMRAAARRAANPFEVSEVIQRNQGSPAQFLECR